MLNQQQKIRRTIENNQNFIQQNQSQKLQIKTLQDNYFKICLSTKLEQLKLESLITFTLENFALYCKQIRRKLTMQKIQVASAFKLDIKNDSITLQTMEHPIIASPHQNLILNPQFINQMYLFENLTYESDTYLDSLFFDELLLTLLFWQILVNLRKLSDLDFYDIYIYPNRCNFYIIKNDITPFFQTEQLKMMNILLNSQTIQLKKDDLEINQEYQIQLFDIHPPDKIVSRGTIIPIININQQEQQSIEQDQEILKYLNFDQITITSKPYYLIFSTLCEQDQKDEFKHIIDFSNSEYPKCKKCNLIIYPDDFDTLYTKKGLLDIWEKGQICLKQQAQFVSPLFFLLGKQNFKLKMDKDKENLFAQFYYKNEEGREKINEKAQSDLNQYENTKDKKELQLLFKKLIAKQPQLNSNLEQKLHYQVTESLEGDDEDYNNDEGFRNTQNKQSFIYQTKFN
ncbi:unnamed protein product [Paramecium sonneborni]|uniref:Uncharacterized protein n=1 Tax=Paramecium sonneborni TaxID=65129 RepID=A0A8S1LST9_9CILI|nr:unnamed protein product [Paramecium sonneborni]